MNRTRYLALHFAYRVVHMIERALSASGWWLHGWCNPGDWLLRLRHEVALHVLIPLGHQIDMARLRRAQGGNRGRDPD